MEFAAFAFLSSLCHIFIYIDTSAYYSAVGPRHPFKKDPALDYDIDSDEEWEEVSITAPCKNN